LTDEAADRAAGVLLAQAAGDALGAPYEFQRNPLPGDTPIRMGGGGSFAWEPGEWTDDTQMSVVILTAAESALADGVTLLDRLDDIAAGWHDWARTATDVGLQTSKVLRTAAAHGRPRADHLLAASAALAASGRRTGGNGSLMRTAPVALAYLGDPESIATAARTISDLTHADPDAADACVLQCVAIDHAVHTGDLDLHRGLAHLTGEGRDRWAVLLAEAEHSPATTFGNNGWVVHAMQAAWSLITRTPIPADPRTHLRLVLEAACRLAGDTDTVAAIAGALVGARWGAAAVPSEWTRMLHGWPGLTGTQLSRRGGALAGAAIGRIHGLG
jgi:ADP-ribosylglycohydrolase